MAKKILVVDDNKKFLDEFCEILRASGYQAATLNNASNFLNVVSEVNPDLILMNMNMRVKNGYDLVTDLDYVTERRHLPVIAMSDFDSSKRASLLDVCRFRAYLRKPLVSDEVFPTIKEVLGEPKPDESAGEFLHAKQTIPMAAQVPCGANK